MKRREFLAASTAMTAVGLIQPALAFTPEPLRALPRLRRIYVRQEPSGSWLFYSDGPATPPKVIRSDVIERVFGEGAYDTLAQPDHWRMIEAGWFSGEDLHQPIPVCDDTYDVWKGFYHPVVEAHDLLADAFAEVYDPYSPFGAGLRNGLELAEHPNTPRYATARADWPELLQQIAEDVARQNRGIEIVLPIGVKCSWG